MPGGDEDHVEVHQMEEQGCWWKRTVAEPVHQVDEQEQRLSGWQLVEHILEAAVEQQGM